MKQLKTMTPDLMESIFGKGKLPYYLRKNDTGYFVYATIFTVRQNTKIHTISQFFFITPLSMAKEFS